VSSNANSHTACRTLQTCSTSAARAPADGDICTALLPTDGTRGCSASSLSPLVHGSRVHHRSSCPGGGPSAARRWPLGVLRPGRRRRALGVVRGALVAARQLHVLRLQPHRPRLLHPVAERQQPEPSASFGVLLPWLGSCHKLRTYQRICNTKAVPNSKPRNPIRYSPLESRRTAQAVAAVLGVESCCTCAAARAAPPPPPPPRRSGRRPPARTPAAPRRPPRRRRPAAACTYEFQHRKPLVKNKLVTALSPGRRMADAGASHAWATLQHG
jgi:hypothetical protein